MADKKKAVDTPKTLEEALPLIEALYIQLDAGEETVGELTAQIKTLQENNEAANKKAGASEKLETSVVQLTKERDEAISENKDLKEENVSLAKTSKDARAERDRIKEIRKQDSVRTAYQFNGENTPVAMTLCGESVSPEKDGTWLLNMKQFKEAVDHGCNPVSTGTPGE